MPKSLISISDFTKEEMLHVLEVAQEFEKKKSQTFLHDKVIACLFFETFHQDQAEF
jgi:aspartate carbamoyltransferase catalytic subunit